MTDLLVAKHRMMWTFICDMPSVDIQRSTTQSPISRSARALRIVTIYSTFSFRQYSQGKEGLDVPGRYAVDLLPEQALHGRSLQPETGDLCLRRRADRRVDDAGWGLR